MTDAELEQLLKDLESDRTERKSSIANKRSILQAICAFANDMPNHGEPGILFVGVDDKGVCANLKVTDELLLQLADIRSNGNILPFPSMSVQKRTICNCDLAVIVVQPSDTPPVRYDGRIWIRVGPRRAAATAEEERQLNGNGAREISHSTFDQFPVRRNRISISNCLNGHICRPLLLRKSWSKTSVA